MSNESKPKTDACRPMVYQFRLKGQLGPEWTDWFEGLTITAQDAGEMLLSGPVADQAALHGLLKKVRDLGIPLISAIQIDPGQANVPGSITDTEHTVSDKETSS